MQNLKHRAIEAHPQCLVVPALILWTLSVIVLPCRKSVKKGLEFKENKLKLKALREERKVKEAANRTTELAMQREQNNQQIEMNMKMMEFLGTLSKKHKRRRED